MVLVLLFSPVILMEINTTMSSRQLKKRSLGYMMYICRCMCVEEAGGGGVKVIISMCYIY